MRTTKRFTPQVLARYERQGRGTGTYEDYMPWHKVSRGDPASSGRSHLLTWRGRLRELLSDGELGQQLFATMLPDLDDSLEQFRLSADSSPHPLTAYCEGDPDQQFPGTAELALSLGIRHPQVSGGGETEPWQLTTDLLLIFKPSGGLRHALALAFKPPGWHTRARTKQLLLLEREFWQRRHVPWLLITPEQSDPRTVLTLRRASCWSLAEEVSPELRRLATEVVQESPYDSLSTILDKIRVSAKSMDLAQRALWQAVWTGELPVDLRRGWRPHVPLALLSHAEFQALNPIASRRSAWI